MSIVRFYPLNEKTTEFADPPEPMSRHLPEWYRRQPATLHSKDELKNGIVKATIKKCMPIFDGMTAGYMLSMPCDVYIDASNPESLTHSVPQAMNMFKGDLFAQHAREQYSEYPLDTEIYHKDVFRINPLYIMETDKGYSTLFIQPLNGDKTPLSLFGAIVDTDRYASDGLFTFMVKKGFQGIIKQGTPLIQAIPFKREDFSSEVLTPADTKKMASKQRLSTRSVFLNGYKNRFRSKKEYK